MDKNIPIQVHDRIAWTGWPGYIVCGNECYTITFTFDEEWDEAAAKTARFKYRTENGMAHTDQPFTGNTVKVPVLSNIREVEVGVFVGDLATTTGATIRCVPSIRCDSGEATEYEKERFDELMQLFNELLHGHENKDILDKFKVISKQDPFYNGTDANDLKYGNGSLRFASEGAVVSRITPIERDDGTKVLRLSLNWGNEMQIEAKDDWIDIPVADVKKVIENNGGITLNGSELDFGFTGGGGDTGNTGDGIRTVQTYRDLPTNAKEGDICVVLNDGYGEDNWRRLSVNDALMDKCPSQITFGNTIDEIMSGCLFNRDNLAEGQVYRTIKISLADGTECSIELYHVKMSGQELTAVLVLFPQENSSDKVGYGITDNGPLFAASQGLAGAPIPSNVWLQFEITATAQNLVPLDEPYVIDGVVGINDLDRYTYTNWDVNNTLHLEIRRNLPKLMLADAMRSLCLGNFAEQKSRGLYIFSDGAWVEDCPKEKIKEYNIDTTYINNSDVADGLDTYITDRDFESIPKGKEGEIAKIYPTIKTTESDRKQRFPLSISGYVNNMVYDNAEYFVEYALSKEIPQATIDSFSEGNGRTILVAAEHSTGSYSGFVSCHANSILVGKPYGNIGLIYFGVADTSFCMKDFHRVLQRMDSTYFLPNEAGWYLFEGDFIIKVDPSNITIESIWNFEIFSGTTNFANSKLYLVEGVTTDIPSTLETETPVELTGLLMSTNQAYEYGNKICDYMWDYQSSSYIKYTSLDGWHTYNEGLDRWKLAHVKLQ